MVKSNVVKYVPMFHFAEFSQPENILGIINKQLNWGLWCIYARVEIIVESGQGWSGHSWVKNNVIKIKDISSRKDFAHGKMYNGVANVLPTKYNMNMLR